MTARQEEVLCHIAAGLTNKQIARLMRLSPATIRTHAYIIYAKLGVHGRVAAAVAYHQMRKA